MGILRTNRALLGNIALVVFLAFLVTLTFGVGSAAADTDKTVQVKDKSDVWQSDTATLRTNSAKTQVELTIKICPLTATEFQSIWFQIKDGVNVLKTVYARDTVYSSAYDNVYGTGYQLVYNWVYAFANILPHAFSLLVYQDSQQLETITLNVEAPPPEGGGGGGAAPAPTPPAQETPTGTAVVDTQAGTATLAVDETKVTAVLQDPAQNQLVLEIPTAAGIKEHAVQIPAAVLALAAEAGKPIVVQAPTGQITILPQALDVPALRELLKTGEKVQVTVAIKEAPEATQGNVALALARPENTGLNLVGPVLDLSVAAKVEGKEPVQVTSFNKALKLRLPYSEADLKGVPEAYLGVYRITGTTLAYVGGKVLAAEDAVEVELSSFSSYALMTYQVAFADTTNHWARQVIELMAAKHIVKGVGANRFTPDATVTRAEFATLLVRALGIAEAKPAAGRFRDVAPGAWYFGTVEAAAEAGLLKGYPDGTFRPAGKITRQEMAAMIVNALRYGGKDVAIGRQEIQQLLGPYTDAPSIGGWAVEAVAVAVREGIIKGRTATTIVPLAGATRAEATVLMKQVLSNLNRI
ncbi:MAG: S-layer homology domain-containing protein [Bacillota bacterium]|nr:S-layer homology domain-containing protein [Bacillota bacterium]